MTKRKHSSLWLPKRYLVAAGVLLLSGCASQAPLTRPIAASVSEMPSPSPIMTASPSPTPYPVSLMALAQKEITGSDLALEETLDDNAAYTRHAISYRVNGLKISGIMNIPKGNGPFPLLLLNHGYIDPAVYTRGRGLKREQDYLARQGFAVLHSDYRNHAFSDKDPQANTNLRLGYVEDVIGAIVAAQASALPELKTVDTKAVGMLGHSMGGGIAQKVAVTRPDLVDAVVLYAPVSGDEAENFFHYIFDDAGRRNLVDEISKTHGLPDKMPRFWREVSPQNYYERITAPFLIFIGTNDESTPPAWSEAIAERLRSAGKEAELVVFEGERHEFGSRWGDFMRQTAAFFTNQLKPAA